jgi:uncharacterized membrane protein
MSKHYDEIQKYLDELKEALNGQSNGLIQDALYDVENHFFEAFENDKDADFNKLIESFGNPREVALQYIRLEEDSKVFLYGNESKKTNFNGFFEPLSSFKDYKVLSYFFVSFPLSILYFGWTMLFGVPALLLSLLFVGLPFLTLFLKTQPYIALIEGLLINNFLNIRMPRRPGREARLDSSEPRVPQVIKRTLKSTHNWRVVLYSVLNLPLSATYFTAVCVLFVSSLALIATPIVDPLVHILAPQFAIDINWYWMPVTTIVGMIGVTLSMHIARILVILHTSIASSLLIQR